MVSSGHIGCLAAVSRVVALPGAYLQQRGYHEADARGGEEVQQGDLSSGRISVSSSTNVSAGGPDLEKHHGKDCVGHPSAAGY